MFLQIKKMFNQSHYFFIFGTLGKILCYQKGLDKNP